jgi:hypothetical protein
MANPNLGPLPVIEPPQDSAPLIGNPQTFTKLWWLFFRDLMRKTIEASIGGTYRIVFSKAASLITGEPIPSYVVLLDGEGIPTRACFRAKVAPIADAKFNMTLTAPGGAPAILFTADVTVPAGSTAPVFASNFALTPRMTEGYLVDLVIVDDGATAGISAAAIFTAELGVQRT